jgi:hypothetical protein
LVFSVHLGMEKIKNTLAKMICEYNGQMGNPKQVEKMRKNYRDNLQNMENYLIQRGLLAKK